MHQLRSSMTIKLDIFNRWTPVDGELLKSQDLAVKV